MFRGSLIIGVLSGQVFNAFLGTLLLPKNNDLDIKNGSGTVLFAESFFLVVKVTSFILDG